MRSRRLMGRRLYARVSALATAAREDPASLLLLGLGESGEHALPSRGPTWLWLVAVLGVIALVLALNGRFPDALEQQGGMPRLLYLLSLLALGGGGLVLAIRRQPLQQLRNAAIWLAIGLVLVIGYSFKNELGPRLLGELVPQRGTANP